MGWWQITIAAVKRIPWGSVLTFGAERWLERRRQSQDAERRPEAPPRDAPTPTPTDPAA